VRSRLTIACLPNGSKQGAHEGTMRNEGTLSAIAAGCRKKIEELFRRGQDAARGLFFADSAASGGQETLAHRPVVNLKRLAKLMMPCGAGVRPPAALLRGRPHGVPQPAKFRVSHPRRARRGATARHKLAFVSSLLGGSAAMELPSSGRSSSSEPESRARPSCLWHEPPGSASIVRVVRVANTDRQIVYGPVGNVNLSRSIEPGCPDSSGLRGRRRV